MPIPFLTKPEHHDLDRRLHDLAANLTPGETLRILEDYKGKLLHATWTPGDTVYWGMFGDVERDQVAKALWDLFKAMKQYTCDATTPRKKEKYRNALGEALRDYLDIRGYAVELDGAPGVACEDKGAPTKKRGAKPSMDPKERQSVVQEWRNFKAGSHGQMADFCKDRKMKVIDLRRMIDADRAAKIRSRIRKEPAHE